MDGEAAEVLRSFYLNLRKKNADRRASNPITLRQIESLMRLTQVKFLKNLKFLRQYNLDFLVFYSRPEQKLRCVRHVLKQTHSRSLR